MLPIDFDPYDFLCKLQDEQVKLRRENHNILKNQRELAAAYNKLKDDFDEQAKLLLEIKHKHNKLVEKSNTMAIRLTKEHM